ncbi:MAG: hypothetical protein WC836_06605 [Desulfobacula sp.]|jgi:hypothetical protein
MKYKELISNLESSISSVHEARYDEINQEVDSLLKRLYQAGKISLAEDFCLAGKALEVRVEKLLKSIGLQIREGRRENLEDFIVNPSTDFTTKIPLAIEVKSGKNQCISRDDLRQLDDWVFELSGEEDIRKRRPPETKNTFYITAGLPPGPDTHLTPHKGVFIFNGSIGTPFENRPTNCIHPNDIEFAKKRFFCVFKFQDIVEISLKVNERELELSKIWESIHNCSGLWEWDMC